jgi:hypothetical protein
VPSLRFSNTYTDPVRVIRVRESWLERTRRGKSWELVEKEQYWIWVVVGDGRATGFFNQAARGRASLRAAC